MPLPNAIVFDAELLHQAIESVGSDTVLHNLTQYLLECSHCTPCEDPAMDLALNQLLNQFFNNAMLLHDTTFEQSEQISRLERSMGMVWDVRERRQCIGGTCVHGRSVQQDVMGTTALFSEGKLALMQMEVSILAKLAVQELPRRTFAATLSRLAVGDYLSASKGSAAEVMISLFECYRQSAHLVPTRARWQLRGWLRAAIDNLLRDAVPQHFILVMQQLLWSPGAASFAAATMRPDLAAERCRSQLLVLVLIALLWDLKSSDPPTHDCNELLEPSELSLPELTSEWEVVQQAEGRAHLLSEPELILLFDQLCLAFHALSSQPTEAAATETAATADQEEGLPQLYKFLQLCSVGIVTCIDKPLVSRRVAVQVNKVLSEIPVSESCQVVRHVRLLLKGDHQLLWVHLPQIPYASLEADPAASWTILAALCAGSSKASHAFCESPSLAGWLQPAMQKLAGWHLAQHLRRSKLAPLLLRALVQMAATLCVPQPDLAHVVLGVLMSIGAQCDNSPAAVDELNEAETALVDAVHMTLVSCGDSMGFCALQLVQQDPNSGWLLSRAAAVGGLEHWLPAIKDVEILTSWLASPAGNPLHQIARRVLLAARHWPAEPCAAYALTLVKTHQSAKELVDLEEAEALYLWLWAAADQLAQTLNSARMQWLHQKVFSALAKPVLQFHPDNECELMRSLYLGTEPLDSFAAYVVLMVTDLAADIENFRSIGVPSADTLIQEHRWISAVNVLLRVISLDEAQTPELTKWVASVLKEISEDSSTATAFSAITGVVLGEVANTNRDVMLTSSLDHLMGELRRTTDLMLQSAEGTEKSTQWLLHWLECICAVDAWEKNQSLLLLIDALIEYSIPVLPRSLAAFFIERVVPLQIEQQKMEGTAPETVSTDEPTKVLIDNTSWSGALVGSSYQLGSSVLSYLAPLSIAATTSPELYVLSASQYVLSASELCWLGFAVSYSCTVSAVRQVNPPVKDLVHMWQHLIQKTGNLRLQNTAWRVLVAVCREIDVSDPELVSAVLACSPQKAQCETELRMALQVFVGLETPRTRGIWDRLCEKMDISLDVLTREDHPLWASVEVQLQSTAEVNTPTHSNTSGFAETDAAELGSEFIDLSESIPLKVAGSSSVRVSMQLSAISSSQVTLSLSVIPAAESSPLELLKQEADAIQTNVVQFARLANELQQVNKSQMNLLRHLYIAKASVKKMVSGCCDTCDGPAVRLYDSFETEADPEAIQLLADNLTRCQQVFDQLCEGAKGQLMKVCSGVHWLQQAFSCPDACSKASQVTLSILRSLSALSNHPALGAVVLWSPALACFVETLLPQLLQGILRTSDEHPEPFLEACSLVCSLSSGSRPLLWQPALEALSPTEWLAHSNPSFESRRRLLNTGLDAVYKFVVDSAPDGCELLGYDKSDVLIQERCQALESCCKIVQAVCVFSLEEHSLDALVGVMQLAMNPSVLLPHDFVCLSVTTLLNGMADLVQSSSGISIPLLLHACELVRIRMMVAQSKDTKLADTSLLAASPMLYRLLKLMLDAAFRAMEADTLSCEALELCWGAMAAAFSPWLFCNRRAALSTHRTPVSQAGLEEKFPWDVTCDDCRSLVLAELSSVTFLFHQKDTRAFGWMIVLVLTTTHWQDSWVLQSYIKALGVQQIPWSQVVPDSALIASMSEICNTCSVSALDVLWSVCTKMQLLEAAEEQSPQYLLQLLELLLHWCKAEGPKFPFRTVSGQAQLQVVPWGQLSQAGRLHDAVELCSSMLPVAELLQTDALVAAPEWCLSALNLIVLVLAAGAGFGTRDANKSCMIPFVRFCALEIKLCSEPQELRLKSCAVLKAIQLGLIAEDNIPDGSVMPEVYEALREVMEVLSAQSLLQRIDILSTMARCINSHAQLAPAMLHVACATLHDLTNLIESCLFVCLDSMVSWDALLPLLDLVVSADMLELCVANNTPLTLFAWAIRPSNHVLISELALVLSRFQQKAGEEALVLPLWTLCLAVGAVEYGSDSGEWRTEMVPSLVDQLWTLAALPEGLSRFVLGNSLANREFQLLMLAMWQFAGMFLSSDPEQRAAAEDYHHQAPSANETSQLAQAMGTAEELMQNSNLSQADLISFVQQVASHAYGKCNWLTLCLEQVTVQVDRLLQDAL